MMKNSCFFHFRAMFEKFRKGIVDLVFDFKHLYVSSLNDITVYYK